MLRIALVQIHLQNNNKAKAVEHAFKLLKKVGSSDSDIVCLPELWYSKIVKNFEIEFDKIIDIAKEYNMVIIPGAFIERSNSNNNDNNKNGNNDLQISSPVIANDGLILGRQLKIHPFGSQRKVVRAGTKVELFEIGNFKFGIGICYDIVFPEVARALVRKGADMLFFPSKIRKEGIKPWHMYVQVRALENRIPIAAPNVCDDDSGKSNNNSVYRGKSIFVDFDYDHKTDITVPKLRLGSAKNNQIIIIDIDLNRTRKLHEKRFQDFRSDFYGQL
jgi:predicted amidohydrolase